MRKMIIPLLLLLACALGRGVWAAGEPALLPAPLPATMVNAKDGAEMVLIPAGTFLMGTTEEQLAALLKSHPGDKRDWFTDETPQHAVYLDAYYLYKNDVTVAQFRTFCTAVGRPMPKAPAWGWQDTHPMVNVSWQDANAYAEWAGVSLPTEAQWEKAARGTDGRIFPWGNAWDAAKCDNSVSQTAPVGSFPAGASPYQCMDMVGNVWQWCADWYGKDYYRHAPPRNPSGPESGKLHQPRGGLWEYDDFGDGGHDAGDGGELNCRVAFRDYYIPDGWYGFIGFRCAARTPGA